MDGALAFDGLSAVEDGGQIDIGAAPHEARGHDADDGADLVVEAQLAAEDGRVAGELRAARICSRER